MHSMYVLMINLGCGGFHETPSDTLMPMVNGAMYRKFHAAVRRASEELQRGSEITVSALSVENHEAM